MKARLNIKDGTDVRDESPEHVSITMEDGWDEYYHQTLKVDREDALKIIAFLKQEFEL